MYLISCRSAFYWLVGGEVGGVSYSIVFVGVPVRVRDKKKGSEDDVFTF